MKVLIIGSEGQLGTELCRAFPEDDVVRADLDAGDHRVDLAAPGQTAALLAHVEPALVINTAAFHNVPRCEEEPALAWAVNATGARDLARACAKQGARLVHISTDYVYGDGHDAPLPEETPPSPLSTYGASKLAGEHLVAAECPNHLIVRSSALYGPAPCRAKEGRNFVNLMLHLAETRGEVRVVTDEVTTPTYTVALAEQVALLARKGHPGVYHASCQGACSWHAFARAIFELTDRDTAVREATRADFPSPVRRPAYSALDNARLRDAGLDRMPPWREALAAFLRDHPPA
jgi:dTDP-4-dehydrorhamnose reductase